MRRSRSTPEAVVSIQILDVLHRHNGFYQSYEMADNKRSVGEIDHQAGLPRIYVSAVSDSGRRFLTRLIAQLFNERHSANGIHLTFCRRLREEILTPLSTCLRASVGPNCLKRIFYRAVSRDSALCSSWISACSWPRLTANALAVNEPPVVLPMPTEAGAMSCSIAPPRLNFARPQKGRALFSAAGSSQASSTPFGVPLGRICPFKPRPDYLWLESYSDPPLYRCRGYIRS